MFLGTSIIPSTAQNIKKQTSRGNWLYVGGSGPGNYSNIQEAITAATDGDTIFVYNGTYSGFTCNKQLTLFGENKVGTVISSGRILLSADWIYCANFTVVGNNCGLDAAIQAGGNNVTVAHCIVPGASVYGIEVGGEYSQSGNYFKTGIVIDDCEVFSCTYAGIKVYLAYKCMIRNCTIHDCIYPSPESVSEGIHIMFSGSPWYRCYQTIFNCEIYNCDIGISVNRHQNYIENCYLHDNEIGADNDARQENSFTGCLFENNTEAGCYLHSHGTVYYSRWNKIVGNVFEGNTVGVYADVNTYENMIHHNNFLNQTAAQCNDHGSNIWDNGYPDGGNYWDDYTGADANGDGIGDTPYYFYGGQDQYPFINPVSMINQPPLTPVISGPSIGMQWVSYTFTALATDPNYDPLYYWFDWGDGTTSGWVGPYGYSYNGEGCHLWTKEGSYNITVKACDLHGDQGPWSISFSFVVLYNNRPEPPQPLNGSVYGIVGYFYNYSTQTVEPDGEEIYFQIDWDEGSLSDWYGPYISNVTFEIRYQYRYANIHHLRVRAKDVNGALSEWSPETIVEIINHPPHNPILEGPPTGLVGEQYTINYSTYDSDGHKLAYYFEFPGFTAYSSWYNSNQTYAYSYTFSKRGVYTYKLRAVDYYGAGSNWSIFNLTVLSATPVIEKPRNDMLYIFNQEWEHPDVYRTIIIGRITIKVLPPDTMTDVTKMLFYVDKNLRFEDQTPPYEWTWWWSPLFRHTLRVVAVNATGGSAETSLKVWKFF